MDVSQPASLQSPASSPESFSSLLRPYRLAAGLTQDAVAERAGVSSRSIQALERDENCPQQETARRLAEALALDEQERARLLRAVTPIPRQRAGRMRTWRSGCVCVPRTTRRSGRVAQLESHRLQGRVHHQCHAP
jgi:transcriptional regulator with XRE-family HTH domain